MSIQIQFLGVASYKIITEDNVHVIIDPFLDSNPNTVFTVDSLERADLMLLTHNAFDHVSDAAKVIEKYQCPVICSKDVMYTLVKYHRAPQDVFRPTIYSVTIKEAGVKVRPLPSIHWGFYQPPDGSELISGPAMSFIIYASESTRIYHQGDSALTYDMKLWGELYQPTAGFILCSIPEGKGIDLPHKQCYITAETTPDEGVLASEWLGLEHIILSHYMDRNNINNKRFLELISEKIQTGEKVPKVHNPEIGEWIVLP